MSKCLEPTSNYISTGYIDPASNIIVPNIGTVLGFLHGFTKNFSKSKHYTQAMIWGTVWAVAGRFAPVPTIALAGYQRYKGK